MTPDEWHAESILSQPLLEVGKRRCPRLLQRATSESPHPAIAHAQCLGDGAMLADAGPYSLPRPLNTFFYAGRC
jgi:hypothetical protein